MTRLFAFAVCSLGAFGLLLALLMIGSAALGRPMPILIAAALCAGLAPLLGWSFERKTHRLLAESFRHGGRHVALLPGPTLGYAVQQLARLSQGDVSVLVLALQDEGPDGFQLCTAPGSDNHGLWLALASLELMGEVRPEPELGETPETAARHFYITPKGKKVIPALLQTALVIRHSVPQLA